MIRDLLDEFAGRTLALAVVVFAATMLIAMELDLARLRLRRSYVVARLRYVRWQIRRIERG
jgi:hypothetical protein